MNSHRRNWTAAWVAAVLSVFVWLPATTRGQEQNNDFIEIVDLGPLSGAPEPDPALKYIFGSYVKKPVNENAAFHYQRAMRRLADAERGLAVGALPWETEWLMLKPSELTDLPIAEFLESTQQCYEALERASRCSYCEWYVETEGNSLANLVSTNLNDMQETRRLARYLELKARDEIRRHDWDAATETMRAAFQLAYDLQEYPVIITGLIGAAVQGITYGEVENWIAEADSPNLYWALSSLRRPSIDLTECIVGEMRMLPDSFSALDDPESKDWTPEQWIQSLTQDFQAVAGSYNGASTAELGGRLAISGMLVRGYPIAKRALLAEGFTEQQLDEMPSAQVVCIHQSRLTHRMIHDILKWRFIDSPEALVRMKAQANESQKQFLNNNRASNFSLLFIPMLLPAYEMVGEAELRLLRSHKVLLTLEAIRLHTAMTGNPPESLAEIQAVPVPIDPKTGQTFRYVAKSDAIEVVLNDYPVQGSTRVYRWTRP